MWLTDQASYQCAYCTGALSPIATVKTNISKEEQNKIGFFYNCWFLLFIYRCVCVFVRAVYYHMYAFDLHSIGYSAGCVFNTLVISLAFLHARQ